MLGEIINLRRGFLLVCLLLFFFSVCFDGLSQSLEKTSACATFRMRRCIKKNSKQFKPMSSHAGTNKKEKHVYLLKPALDACGDVNKSRKLKQSAESTLRGRSSRKAVLHPRLGFSMEEKNMAWGSKETGDVCGGKP